MAKFACNCPKCKWPLQFDGGDQKQIRIICPKCQNRFQIKVSGEAAPVGPGPASTEIAPKSAVRQPANHSFSDQLPLPLVSPPFQLDHYSPPVATWSQPKRTKKTSVNVRKLLLPAVMTLASIGGIGLITVGIMWGKQFLPNGSTSGGLASAFSSSLFGSDSRSSVEADHLSLRTHVEEIGRSIPAGDQSEQSAHRLRAELPKFHALFRRVCQLPIETRSLEEFANEGAEFREAMERARNQSQSASSSATPVFFAPTFWSVKTNAAPSELVNHAISELTSASSSINMILLKVLVDYPDPLTYTGTQFEWSNEDRRILAIIRLQGSLQRDALRVLSAVDPKAPAAKDLNKVHSMVDRAFESATELRKLPRKTLSGILAFVPKGNPYEPQQLMASNGLSKLRELKKAEATLPAEVDFLFDEVEAFSDMCEGIIFGSTNGSSTLLALATTSSGRFEAFVTAEEKKQVDARQAEIRRQEDEKQKLAEAQLRKQMAIEQEQKQEAERKRAVEERMANASSGKMGGRLGSRGPDGLTDNIGPRPGQIGAPTGAIGDSRKRMTQPDFSGFGSGPQGLPNEQFHPPVANQGDPAAMVTITAANVKNGNSADFVRNPPKWLLQYSPSVRISNGNLKITLQNYDKPLADLESGFPSLVFENIDTESRTIVAREK